jgi:Cu-Zn family superoxide dismutase
VRARGVIAVLVVLGVAVAVGGQEPAAQAELVGSRGQKVGRALFFLLSDGGVRIRVEVQGLTPGEHGIHIHAVGRCDPPDFLTAAGHFNPDGRRHGLLNPQGPHAGDLPNLVVRADGRARYEAVSYRVTLDRGPSGLFDAGGRGRALVIHAQADDHLTDPAGNSGPRVACGVIAPR